MSTEHPGPTWILRHLGILVEVAIMMAALPGVMSGVILFDRFLGRELALNPLTADIAVVGILVFSIGYIFLVARIAKGRSGGYGGTPTRRWILLSILRWVMVGMAVGVVLALGVNGAWLHPMAVIAYPAGIAFLVGGLWLPSQLRRWMDARARVVHARPRSAPRYSTAIGQCFERRHVGRWTAVLSVSFTDGEGQERYFRTLTDNWSDTMPVVIMSGTPTATPLLIMYRADDPSRVVHVCEVLDRRAQRRTKG